MDSKNLFYKMAAMAVVALAFAACAEDVNVPENGMNNGKKSVLSNISVNIRQDWNNNASRATRAARPDAAGGREVVTAEGTIGGQTVYMWCDEIDGINGNETKQSLVPSFGDKEETRGVLMDVSKFHSSFTVWGEKVAAGTVATRLGTDNRWGLNHEFTWADDNDYTFYGVAPDTTAVFTNQTQTGFTYTTPLTAKKQPDIMVGTATAKRTDKEMRFQFSHVMSAIKFKIGSNNFKDGYTITKIELKGIELANTYTFETDSWGSATATGTVGENYNFDISANHNTLITSDFEGTTFIVLPQTVPSGALVVITLKDNSTQETSMIAAAIGGKTWEKGHTYTYTLGPEVDNSTFILSVEGTPTFAYNYQNPATMYGSHFGVTSYRETPEGDREPVAWEIVKYEYSDDDGATWTDNGASQPEWLISTTLGVRKTVYGLNFDEVTEYDDEYEYRYYNQSEYFETPEERDAKIAALKAEFGNDYSYETYEYTEVRYPGGITGTGGEEMQPGYVKINSNDYILDLKTPIDNTLKNAPAKNDYDLSLYDSKGVAWPGGRNTANSYLISSPGTYRIPLVYGNAIKNGETNTSSYQSEKSGYSSGYQNHPVMETFINYEGNGITNPWINADVSGTATSADVVWTNLGQYAVKNLAVDGDFLTFEIDRDYFRQGNAVVAVKDADGVVMWSWHLWFATDDALETITCTNNLGHEYAFTKMTLGFNYHLWEKTSYDQPRKIRVTVQQTESKSGEAPKTGTFVITQNPGENREFEATFYQWGRKDAFPGFQYGVAPTYETLYAPIAIGRYNTALYTNVQIHGTAIRNPHLRLSNITTHGGSHDSEMSMNLWSVNCETTAWWVLHEKVVKTVYDPCPAGFHVAESGAFTGFTTSGGEEFYTPEKFNVEDASPETYNTIKGWNFYSYGKGGATEAERRSSPTVYFPATGHTEDSFYRGSIGYYWSAHPSNHFPVVSPSSGSYIAFVSCRGLHFHGRYVQPACFKDEGANGPRNYSGSSYFARGQGMAVRPVADY